MSQHIVSSGHLLSGLNIGSGDVVTVLPGGELLDALLRTGATENLSGLSEGTLLDGGTANVLAGGIASGTMIEAGVQVVASGGSSVRTVVSSAGTQIIEVGGTASHTILLGGTEILSGGASDRDKVEQYGKLIVSAGGESERAVLSGYNATEIVDSGGLAAQTVVSNGGQLVLSAGQAIRALLQTGGQAVISSGGVLAGANVGSGASVTVSYGGLVQNTELASGASIYIYSSAHAQGLTLEKGSDATVAFGGRMTHAVVRGELMIESGARAESSFDQGMISVYGKTDGDHIANGGVEVIFSGGLAQNSVVGSGGEEAVASGARAENGLVQAGGTFFVESGAHIENVVVQSGGILLDIFGGGHHVTSETGAQVVDSGVVILSGGYGLIAAADTLATTVTSGETEYVLLHGIASGAVVSTGATQQVDRGGKIFGGVLNGTRTVSAGAIVSGSTIAGGNQVLDSGARGFSDTVTGGGGHSGEDTVEAGASETRLIVGSGGVVIVAGTLQRAQLTSGALYLESGARATGLHLTSGYMTVQSGAVASGAILVRSTEIVASGGLEVGGVVSSGAVLELEGRSGALGMASHETVASGGQVYVYAGGVLSGGTLQSGGLLTLAGGAVSGAIVDAGATLSVASGTVTGAAIHHGATLAVYRGGALSGGTIGAGANVTVYSGGVLSDAQIAANVNLTISAGGILAGGTIEGRDLVVISSGSVISGVTIDDKAVVVLLSGGQATSNTVASGGQLISAGVAVFSGTQIQQVAAAGSTRLVTVSSGEVAQVLGSALDNRLQLNQGGAVLLNFLPYQSGDRAMVTDHNMIEIDYRHTVVATIQLDGNYRGDQFAVVDSNRQIELLLTSVATPKDSGLDATSVMHQAVAALGGNATRLPSPVASTALSYVHSAHVPVGAALYSPMAEQISPVWHFNVK